MLEVWLFPAFDLMVLPLFWLPRSLSLTLVSFLTGVLMIFLYWLTSDQWRMAHEKRRIKVAQNELMRGNYGWDNVSTLLSGNLNLTLVALVPAVVTVALILVMIPWVGSRFGYYVPEVREPVSVTVRAEKSWQHSADEGLRTTVLERSKGEGTLLRVMGLRDGTHRIRVAFGDGSTGEIPVSVGTGRVLWPDLSRPKWYHAIVKPAGRTLAPDAPLESVHLGYATVFGSLGFSFFGTFLPGWLTYFFVFSFFVGIYFKFRYSIE